LVKAAIFECQVDHVRRTPLRHRFRYATYLWLVDVDHLPALPSPFGALAGFDARDHLGGAEGSDRSVRGAVDRYLSAEGIDLAGGSVWMLSAARVLGYVFNPLSVFWCFDADGRPLATVAEVHNTYGERHAYLLHPDEHGRASVDKAFYVSPFEAVVGRYDMRLPVPADDLDVAITLHRPGQEPFVATLRGTRRPATVAALVRTALRHPLAPLMVTLRIRRQGIALWWRGLPIVPRPTHATQPNHAHPQEVMQ
jgi:hypothetical protein